MNYILLCGILGIAGGLLVGYVLIHDKLVHLAEVEKSIENSLLQNYLELSCEELTNEYSQHITEQKKYFFPYKNEPLLDALKIKCSGATQP